MNEICAKCIQHCKKNDSNLLNFSETNNIKIGQVLSCKEDGSILTFAPAGNFPPQPAITVCGLATSLEALNYITCQQLQNSKNSKKESDIQLCAKSVYKGRMAVKLFLMLGALGLHKIFYGDLTLYIEKSNGQNDIELSSIFESDPIALFREEGYFVSIPANTQLTQATCCWSKNGKVQSQKEWLKYSVKCKEEGYLTKIVEGFSDKENDSKIFIGLGKGNKSILGIIKKISANHPSNTSNIKVVAPEWWGTKTVINDFEKKCSNLQKIICLIHHPANTKHIFNPHNTSKQYKSVLYRFYEQWSSGNYKKVSDCWKDLVTKTQDERYWYGETKNKNKDKMIESFLDNVRYYRKLSKYIDTVTTLQ